MIKSGFEPKFLSFHSLGTCNHDAKLTVIIKLSSLAPKIVKSNGGERNLNKIFLYCMLNTTLRRYIWGTMRRLTNSASGHDNFIEEGDI